MEQLLMRQIISKPPKQRVKIKTLLLRKILKISRPSKALRVMLRRNPSHQIKMVAIFRNKSQSKPLHRMHRRKQPIATLTKVKSRRHLVPWK